MEYHLLNLILFAVVISILFAIPMREGSRERIGFALRLSGLLVGLSVLAGWLMRLAG